MVIIKISIRIQLQPSSTTHFLYHSVIVFVAEHTRISSQMKHAYPLFTPLLLLILSTIIKSLLITLQKVSLSNFSDRGMLSPNCSLTPHKLSASSLNNFHLFLPLLVLPLWFWSCCENFSHPQFASEMSSH